MIVIRIALIMYRCYSYSLVYVYVISLLIAFGLFRCYLYSFDYVSLLFVSMR